jgi:hypothetical protein
MERRASETGVGDLGGGEAKKVTKMKISGSRLFFVSSSSCSLSCSLSDFLCFSIVTLVSILSVVSCCVSCFGADFGFGCAFRSWIQSISCPFFFHNTFAEFRIMSVSAGGCEGTSK